MADLTFHLIANAHLDPVWLWDWREGLNEALVTTRAVLDLMDEFPELTFSRGETAVYRHVEEHDPALFARLAAQVAAGRWEPVGGTVVQPDTNLPATETFARHFAHGLSYFRARFGRRVRVAWAADSFGHAAGLPAIMAAAGIEGFFFTRPFAAELPLAKPAFWWEGPGGARVLAYRPPVGWYGTERDEVPRRLDALLAAAASCDLENVGVFHGLGDHGGGPSRRLLREIASWCRTHPRVRAVHSGLHRLHDALRDEARRKGADFLPVHRGELNFCLRGCYASVAKFKFAYRRTESALAAAERGDAVVRSALGQAPADCRRAWEAVLFNSFHDILPGSAIERAYDEQLAWLGCAFHSAQELELGALNALAGRVDTRVPVPAGDHPAPVALLVWNPHPWPYAGHVEWEACLDYRPVASYRGRADALPLEVRGPSGRRVPFQSVATESALQSWDTPWRKRVVVPVQLPPLGWAVYRFGWVEGARPPAVRRPAGSPRRNVIDNGFFSVAAREGARGIRLRRGGRGFLGGAGLSAVVVDDPHGSWGGPETPAACNLSRLRERWRVVRAVVLERGPERAALHARLAGARSWLDLTFHLCRGRDAVDVVARLLWNERGARLKLRFPVGAAAADFDVPGATVRRAPCGEVPGGRWVRVHDGRGRPVLGFASDALYAFDLTRGALRATVARASGYAFAGPPALAEHRPAADCGELRFRFVLTPGDSRLPFQAQELEQPPTVLLVAPKAGPWPRSGSLAALSPSSLRLLAIKRAADGNGVVLRVQETAGRDAAATLTWLGKRLALGRVRAGAIASWRLTPGGKGWTATPTDITEAKPK
jgi:alpha-mannosidase